MEDLIPLLIGVIWLAFTIYSRGKKKKPAAKSGSRQSPASEPQKPREPSILEQILMGQEIRVPEPEPYYDEEEAEEEVTWSPENEKVDEAVPEKKSYRAFLSEELSGIEEEGQYAFDYNEDKEGLEVIETSGWHEPVLGEDFDLRKAIIYEAVLNPPYIDFK